MLRIATFTIAASLAACSPQMREAKVDEALALSVDHFKNTATVKDSSLDLVATITTEPGFSEKRGLLGVVWNDNFIRAIVDKKTGKTTYQVYQAITYTGDSWKFYHSANYETPNGPVFVKAQSISRDVQCSQYGCTHYEHVAFTVPESLLRGIAKTHSNKPQARVWWRFKFNSKAGEDLETGMLPNEIAGALARVDQYKSARGLM